MQIPASFPAYTKTQIPTQTHPQPMFSGKNDDCLGISRTIEARQRASLQFALRHAQRLQQTGDIQQANILWKKAIALYEILECPEDHEDQIEQARQHVAAFQKLVEKLRLIPPEINVNSGDTPSAFPLPVIFDEKKPFGKDFLIKLFRHFPSNINEN